MYALTIIRALKKNCRSPQITIKEVLICVVTTSNGPVDTCDAIREFMLKILFFLPTFKHI